MSTLSAFSLPDTAAEIARWLDGVLLSEKLGAVVAELQAVHSPDSSSTIQTLVLPEGVYTQGCSVLSEQQIEHLLTHPTLLLDLQEQILIRDDEFWRERILGSQPISQSQMDAGWHRLSQSLTTPMRDTLPAPPDTSTTGSDRTPSRFFSHLLTSVSTAALVLVGVFLWDSNRDDNPVPKAVAGWGWNAPEALDHNLPADQYLQKLADGGQAWFNKRPATEQEFATRLLQYRRGCSRLILSKHPVLSEDDQQWLVQKCQAWAVKLDKHLADLEQGVDLETVRKETGETVNALVKALRTKA